MLSEIVSDANCLYVTDKMINEITKQEINMAIVEYKNLVLNIKYKEKFDDKLFAEEYVHRVNKISSLTDIVAKVVK